MICECCGLNKYQDPIGRPMAPHVFSGYYHDFHLTYEEGGSSWYRNLTQDELAAIRVKWKLKNL